MIVDNDRMKSTCPPIKRLNRDLVKNLCERAAESPRLRANFNFHDLLSDPVQRFLNVMQPGTYVRPHRHSDPAKWEMTVALSGRAVMLILDANGAVSERIELDATGPDYGIEIPAGVWHTGAALAADTVLLEIKPGPYEPTFDKDFASWAPPEGSAECGNFVHCYCVARPGDLLRTDEITE